MGRLGLERRGHRHRARALSILLGAALLSSCGGGAGLAILTVGVSAMFVGNSPGFLVRDPMFSTGTTTLSAEPDIVLADGESVDRVLMLGGEMTGDVHVTGLASPSGSTATLSMIAYFLRAGEVGATSSTPGADFAFASSTLAAPSTTVDVTLRVSPLMRPLRLNPGDMIVVRFAATGGLTMHASAFRIETEVLPASEVVLYLGSQAMADLPASPGSFNLGGGITTTFSYSPIQAGSQAGSTGVLYSLRGMPSKTTQPASMAWTYSGQASYSLHLRTATGTTATVTLALDVGTTSLGSTTPVTVTDQGSTLSGSFKGSIPVSLIGDATTPPGVIQLRIFSSNRVDVITDPDPANGSTIRLGLDDVKAKMPNLPAFSALQPPH